MTECDLPDPVPKDPGLRPPFTAERQRLNLAQIGPQQPKLFNYPQNEDITSSSKQNRFTAVWFSQYPFFEYSIEKDAAFCYGIDPNWYRSRTLDPKLVFYWS